MWTFAATIKTLGDKWIPLLFTPKDNQLFHYVPFRLSVNMDLITTVMVQTERGRTVALGSGCGSVGRAVASNNRDLWFESGKWQISLTCNCVENTKIKMKEDGNGKIKKNLTHKQK